MLAPVPCETYGDFVPVGSNFLHTSEGSYFYTQDDTLDMPVEEELYWHDRRAVWSVRGEVTKQFTFPSPILAAVITYFQYVGSSAQGAGRKAGAQPVRALAFLHAPTDVHIYAFTGFSYDVIVPFKATRLWALPHGLLIEGNGNLGSVLHPLDAVKPVGFLPPKEMDEMQEMDEMAEKEKDARESRHQHQHGRRGDNADVGDLQSSTGTSGASSAFHRLTGQGITPSKEKKRRQFPLSANAAFYEQTPLVIQASRKGWPEQTHRWQESQSVVIGCSRDPPLLCAYSPLTQHHCIYTLRTNRQLGAECLDYAPGPRGLSDCWGHVLWEENSPCTMGQASSVHWTTSPTGDLYLALHWKEEGTLRLMALSGDKNRHHHHHVQQQHSKEHHPQERGGVEAVEVVEVPGLPRRIVAVTTLPLGLPLTHAKAGRLSPAAQHASLMPSPHLLLCGGEGQLLLLRGPIPLATVALCASPGPTTPPPQPLIQLTATTHGGFIGSWKDGSKLQCGPPALFPTTSQRTGTALLTAGSVLSPLQTVQLAVAIQQSLYQQRMAGVGGGSLAAGKRSRLREKERELASL